MSVATYAVTRPAATQQKMSAAEDSIRRPRTLGPSDPITRTFSSKAVGCQRAN